MSPQKRRAFDAFNAKDGDDGYNSARPNEVKRLRGGGRGEDDPPEDFFPDEEDFMDEMVEVGDEQAEQIPDVDIETAESMRKRWVRPPISVKNNEEDVNMQWLDIDMIAGVPLSENPNKNRGRVIGSTNGQVPVIRVYGVNESGNSVATYIHGYTPYGYFALPPNSTFEDSDENLGKIRHYINTQLEAASRQSRLPEYCRAVQYIDNHKSIMGYDTPDTRFFKVMVAMPTLIPPLKRIMEGGIDLPCVSTSESNIYQAFECNVPFVLRYMIDRDISGAGWLTLPGGTYQIRDESKKQTHCQVGRCLLCGLLGKSFCLTFACTVGNRHHIHRRSITETRRRME